MYQLQIDHIIEVGLTLFKGTFKDVTVVMFYQRTPGFIFIRPFLIVSKQGTTYEQSINTKYTILFKLVPVKSAPSFE